MSVYASLFDKFNANGNGLDEKQKSALFRQGLLNFGLSSLATKGQGFGGSFASGLKGGLLSMQDGAENIENQRYKDEILARTRAGMERNTALEAAQKGILNPDGSINEEQWGSYAALDPTGALDIRTKATPKQPKWELKQIGDGTPGGLLDVLYNPDTQEMRDLQGGVVSGGLLGQQGPQLGEGNLGQQPTGGLLGADVLPKLEQAVMHVESRGNPNAVSPKGARGTMQTMPETLLDPGYGVQPARDQSPAELERVGKDYLAAMLKQYGDPKLALAAYNWGPGNVDKALKRHGGNADAVIANSNPETRAYVPAVLGQLGQVAQAPSPMQSRIGRRPAKPAAGGAEGDKAANWQIVQGADGTFTRINKLTGEEAATGTRGNNAAKIQKMEQERLEKVQGFEGGITMTRDAISTIDALKNSKGLANAVGTSSILPSIRGSEAYTFERQLDTFKSQTFVPMVAQLKGMGALSDAEGKKLSEAVGALDVGMGEAAFKQSLDDIKKRLTAAMTAANKKIADTNVAYKNQYTGQSAPVESGPKRLKFNPATGRLE